MSRVLWCEGLSCIVNHQTLGVWVAFNLSKLSKRKDKTTQEPRAAKQRISVMSHELKASSITTIDIEQATSQSSPHDTNREKSLVVSMRRGDHQNRPFSPIINHDQQHTKQLKLRFYAALSVVQLCCDRRKKSRRCGVGGSLS